MKKTDKIHKNRKKVGHEMGLLSTLQPGESFYTSALPKVVTRYAAEYNKKVKTERVITVHYSSNSHILAHKITKVTIL